MPRPGYVMNGREGAWSVVACLPACRNGAGAWRATGSAGPLSSPQVTGRSVASERQTTGEPEQTGFGVVEVRQVFEVCAADVADREQRRAVTSTKVHDRSEELADGFRCTAGVPPGGPDGYAGGPVARRAASRAAGAGGSGGVP
ncbi:hypothetical protein GCM10009827_026770 [Dactylosporangium maewongense]|uniref:Uncharacterized protein n=1 Tax=Dactylosporangium maewongense TaxID=634393 RepID=A0ABN2A526_9ACTN